MPKRQATRVRSKRQAKKPSRYEQEEEDQKPLLEPKPEPSTTDPPPPPQTVNEEFMRTVLDKLHALEKTLQKRVEDAEAQPSTSGMSKAVALPSSSEVINLCDNERDTPRGQGTNDQVASNKEEEDTSQQPSVYSSIIDFKVPKKVRKKIINDKFIEICELLPELIPDNKEYTIQVGDEGAAFLVPLAPKVDLTFDQWCEAFDIFISVYIETAKSRIGAIDLLKALLTYKKSIRDLHKSGHDWAGYDRNFRHDREHYPLPWYTHRIDLWLQYSRPRTPPAFPNHSNQPRSLRTHDGNIIPLGHCILFHSRNKMCEASQCPYVHKCPHCPVRHPIYRPCPPSAANHSRSPSPEYYPY